MPFEAVVCECLSAKHVMLTIAGFSPSPMHPTGDLGCTCVGWTITPQFWLVLRAGAWVALLAAGMTVLENNQGS